MIIFSCSWALNAIAECVDARQVHLFGCRTDNVLHFMIGKGDEYTLELTATMMWKRIDTKCFVKKKMWVEKKLCKKLFTRIAQWQHLCIIVRQEKFVVEGVCKHIHLIDLSVDFVVSIFFHVESTSTARVSLSLAVCDSHIRMAKHFCSLFLLHRHAVVPYRRVYVLRRYVLFFGLQSELSRSPSPFRRRMISLPSNATMTKMTDITTKCVPCAVCYFVEACRFPSRKYYFHKQHRARQIESK